MTDRIPGAPGRCKAVVTGQELQKLQSGEEFAITLRRDDQPVQEGTPYSKAAVLPDALAGKICPGIQDPTPGDAFSALQSQKADTVRQAGGQNILLPDAANTPMMGLKLFNKNLLEINEVTFNDTYSVELEKPIPTGSYAFYTSGITTTNTSATCRIGFYSNGTEIQAIQAEKIAGYTNVSFTAPVDKIYFYAGTSYSNALGHDATFKDMMISVDGGAYVPYFSGGDVTVRVAGKNLIDYRKATNRPETTETVTIDESINGVYWTGAYWFIIPVSIPAGTTVYFDCESQCDTSDNYINAWMLEYTDGTALYSGIGYSLTAEKDVSALRVRRNVSNNRDTIKVWNMQLEIGNTATAYEPHKEPQTLTVSVPNGLGSDGFVCEDLAQLHTYSPTTIITNDAGVEMEVIYYTPSTAVQMVHSPADKDKLFSIDEHGCAILVERESITEKAMAAVERLETDVKNLDASDGALYVALSRHEEDTSNPHNVTADQLDMADFVVDQDTTGALKWRRWKSGLAECWGEMSVSAEGSVDNTDHCDIFSDLPVYFTHFDSVQVTVLSTDPTNPGDSQYTDVLTNLFMSVLNIDAEAEQERLVVRFGVISGGGYSMLGQAVSNVRISVRVSGTAW